MREAIQSAIRIIARRRCHSYRNSGCKKNVAAPTHFVPVRASEIITEPLAHNPRLPDRDDLGRALLNLRQSLITYYRSTFDHS